MWTLWLRLKGNFLASVVEFKIRDWRVDYSLKSISEDLNMQLTLMCYLMFCPRLWQRLKTRNRPHGKESTEVRKSQIKGKESENSYHELTVSLSCVHKHLLSSDWKRQPCLLKYLDTVSVCLCVPVLRWSLQFLVRALTFLSLNLWFSYFGTFLSTWSLSLFNNICLHVMLVSNELMWVLLYSQRPSLRTDGYGPADARWSSWQHTLAWLKNGESG